MGTDAKLSHNVGQSENKVLDKNTLHCLDKK